MPRRPGHQRRSFYACGVACGTRALACGVAWVDDSVLRVCCVFVRCVADVAALATRVPRVNIMSRVTFRAGMCPNPICVWGQPIAGWSPPTYGVPAGALLLPDLCTGIVPFRIRRCSAVAHGVANAPPCSALVPCGAAVSIAIRVAAGNVTMIPLEWMMLGRGAPYMLEIGHYTAGQIPQRRMVSPMCMMPLAIFGLPSLPPPI